MGHSKAEYIFTIVSLFERSNGDTSLAWKRTQSVTLYSAHTKEVAFCWNWAKFAMPRAVWTIIASCRGKSETSWQSANNSSRNPP